jgi:hypothetical protein
MPRLRISNPLAPAISKERLGARICPVPDRRTAASWPVSSRRRRGLPPARMSVCATQFIQLPGLLRVSVESKWDSSRYSKVASGLWLGLAKSSSRHRLRAFHFRGSFLTVPSWLPKVASTPCCFPTLTLDRAAPPRNVEKNGAHGLRCAEPLPPGLATLSSLPRGERPSRRRWRRSTSSTHSWRRSTTNYASILKSIMPWRSPDA